MTEQLDQDDEIRIPIRYQIVRIDDNEYKLVSLLESLRIKIENESGLLDLILPLVSKGGKLKDMLKHIPESKKDNANNTIMELFKRGLVEKTNLKGTSSLGEKEKERYSEQLKFFDNFDAYINAQSNIVHANSTDSDNSSFFIQKKLKESKVLVIGLGRIGSKIVKALSYVGIGNIIGHDSRQVTKDDIFDSSFDEDDISNIRENVLVNKIKSSNDLVNYTILGKKIWDDKNNIIKEHVPDVNLIILCDDFFDLRIHNLVNKLSLEKKIPWISYRNMGTNIEVGPTIFPRETGCFTCYQSRRNSNSDFYEESTFSSKQLSSQNSSLGTLNISPCTDILTLEIMKILTNFSRPITYGNIFSLNLISLESAIHPLIKIPRCKDCGVLRLDKPSVNIWQPGGNFEN